MKSLLHIASLFILVCMLAACQLGPVYNEFVEVSDQGWQRDSVSTFTFHIDDTLSSYQMLIYLRYVETYPYQNIWLFVHDAECMEQPHDTLEYYLANDRGEWLGQGKNGVIEMPMLYQQERYFSHSGDYTLRVQQAMRDECLMGIRNIGLVIKKNGQK